MSASTMADLDCARHQRWLTRLLGSNATLFVLTSEGQLLWPADAQPPQVLLKAIPPAGALRDNGLHVVDVDEHQCIVFRALGKTGDHFLGWGALQFSKSAVPNGLQTEPADVPEQVADAFADALDAIQEECQQKFELEGVTDELMARYEELHLVYSFDQHIQESSGDYEQIFRNMLNSAACHLMVDVVTLIMPDDPMKLHVQSLSKPIHNLDLVLVEMRGDLFRFVQSSGQTVVLNDATDPRRAYIFTDMPYKILACPIKVNDTIDAMVVLLNHSNKLDFTNSDRKLAEILATQLAILRTTYSHIRRLRDFNHQIAQSLTEAVEAKDPYTRGHSDRVSMIAVRIGECMDLDPSEIEELRWASLLHDVGKIGIPDAILCKPSALTIDEFTFIKVHSERSYDILKHMKEMAGVAHATRYHHERYDGKGYPKGLRGERIPLLSRIIAVADTYDSITSSRAYRPGRTHEVAMAEIQRVSGTQFDSKIVRIFVQIFVDDPAWLGELNIRSDGVHA